MIVCITATYSTSADQSTYIIDTDKINLSHSPNRQYHAAIMKAIKSPSKYARYEFEYGEGEEEAEENGEFEPEYDLIGAKVTLPAMVEHTITICQF